MFDYFLQVPQALTFDEIEAALEANELVIPVHDEPDLA